MLGGPPAARARGRGPGRDGRCPAELAAAFRDRRLDPDTPRVRADTGLPAIIPADPVLGAGLVLDHLEDLATTLGGSDLLGLDHDPISDIRAHLVPPGSGRRLRSSSLRLAREPPL